MPRVRTSVMLDETLVVRVGRIFKLKKSSDILERALKEAIRRESLQILADGLGSDDVPMVAAPRRRPA